MSRVLTGKVLLEEVILVVLEDAILCLINGSGDCGTEAQILVSV